MCARKISVSNNPSAISIAGSSQLVLLDSTLQGSGTNEPAIAVKGTATLLSRDVTLSGYGAAIAVDGKTALAGNFIGEHIVGKTASATPGVPATTLRLPVKEAPVILPESDLSKWANVDDFGAVGDGLTDDTAAVQRAMNSGKPVVWFPKAHYVINGTVDIPSSVREVDYLWAAIYRRDLDQKAELNGGESQKLAFIGEPPDAVRPALFRVSKASKEPLLLRQNLNAGGVFLDHEAQRPVVLEGTVTYFWYQRAMTRGADMFYSGAPALKTSIWRLYRNTTPQGDPKEVFVNNVQGFAPGGDKASLAVENVRVWIRGLNNEYQVVQHAFRKSTVWLFGFKSEDGHIPGTIFHVSDQSRLEVLGGIQAAGQGAGSQTLEQPMVIASDSLVSLTFVTWGGTKAQAYKTLLRDENKGQITEVLDSEFDRRRPSCPGETTVPLLMNRPK